MEIVILFVGEVYALKRAILITGLLVISFAGKTLTQQKSDLSPSSTALGSVGQPSYIQTTTSTISEHVNTPSCMVFPFSVSMIVRKPAADVIKLLGKPESISPMSSEEMFTTAVEQHVYGEQWNYVTISYDSEGIARGLTFPAGLPESFHYSRWDQWLTMLGFDNPIPPTSIIPVNNVPLWAELATWEDIDGYRITATLADPREADVIAFIMLWDITTYAKVIQRSTGHPSADSRQYDFRNYIGKPLLHAVKQLGEPDFVITGDDSNPHILFSEGEKYFSYGKDIQSPTLSLFSRGNDLVDTVTYHPSQAYSQREAILAELGFSLPLPPGRVSSFPPLWSEVTEWDDLNGYSVTIARSYPGNSDAIAFIAICKSMSEIHADRAASLK